MKFAIFLWKLKAITNVVFLQNFGSVISEKQWIFIET